MPGVTEVNQDSALSESLDELEVVIGAGTQEDFENIIRFIPL